MNWGKIERNIPHLHVHLTFKAFFDAFFPHDFAVEKTHWTETFSSPSVINYSLCVVIPGPLDSWSCDCMLIVDID